MRSAIMCAKRIVRRSASGFVRARRGALSAIVNSLRIGFSRTRRHGRTAPREGSAEIRKTRPALILQNDIANRASAITIVAAITSRFDEELYPTEVPIRAREGGLSTDSVVLLNQIRSIAKQRLVRRIGKLTSARCRTSTARSP